MKIKHRFPFPGWLYLTLTVVYHELMLHLWVADPIQPDKLLTVLLLSAGYGLILAALLPDLRWRKGLLLALGFLTTVLCLTEFFVYDAYAVFMAPATILSGAGGVAADYFDIVMSLLSRSFWRIAGMLLPTAAYGLLCTPVQIRWKMRSALAGAAVLAFLLGTFSAKTANQLAKTFEFDSAVRTLGLNTAVVLDLAGSSQKEQTLVFVPDPTEAAGPQETRPTEPTEEPETVYEDQVMAGVDFGDLAQKASGYVSETYKYLAAQSPAKKNAYTGLFAGKNLVFITAEAFTKEVIDPELTPTLHRLATQGIQFADYYQPAWGASTTSGEFSNLFGIMPTTGGACMLEASQQKMFLSMGFQLADLGYKSLCYHANDAGFYNRNMTHTKLGYESFVAIGTGLSGLSSDYPYSDLETINLTMEDYIHQQPFSVYYMSFSGHSPYTKELNDHTRNYFDQVEHLEYSDVVKGYLASQLDLEAALTSLVSKLEELGIADDTVIVLGTDHYPYGLAKSVTWKNSKDHMAELFGVKSYDHFWRDHSALILWSGCLEGRNITVEEPVFSLDILPTLSNLFGVEYDSRLLVGRDVFSDQEPIIFWPNSSWKTDQGTYDFSSGIFTPAEGVTVEDGYVDRIRTIVANRITYSQSVSDYNFFGQLASDIGK